MTMLFEYGLNKTGTHRLALVRGALCKSDMHGPTIMPDDSSVVMGELQELTDRQLVERQWGYSDHMRTTLTTLRGQRVTALIAPNAALRLETSVWMYPRLSGNVYVLHCPSRMLCGGSLREIIHQMESDPIYKTLKGFIKRQVAALARMKVSVESQAAIEQFFKMLTFRPRRGRYSAVTVLGRHAPAGGVFRLEQVWPQSKRSGRRN